MHPALCLDPLFFPPHTVRTAWSGLRRSTRGFPRDSGLWTLDTEPTDAALLDRVTGYRVVFQQATATANEGALVL